MSNAPFKIGQKVVAVANFKPNPDNTMIPKKGEIFTCQDFLLGLGRWYMHLVEIQDRAFPIGDGTQINFRCDLFAPIQTNYSDATSEILEKFKQTEETPDKILIPEKITHDL